MKNQRAVIKIIKVLNILENLGKKTKLVFFLQKTIFDEKSISFFSINL